MSSRSDDGEGSCPRSSLETRPRGSLVRTLIPGTVGSGLLVIGDNLDPSQLFLGGDEARDVLVSEPEAVCRHERLVYGLPHRAREAERLGEVRVGPEILHGIGQGKLKPGHCRGKGGEDVRGGGLRVNTALLPSQAASRLASPLASSIG